MNKKRAFTLIELLVVIAIIALLMSILMPALAKAKKQALAVADLAVKHQMAIITSSYTSDNDGYFLERSGVGSVAAYRKMWMYVYKPYYKDPQMRFCPAAKNPKRVTGPFGTWNYGLGSYSPTADPSLLMKDESEFDVRVGTVIQGFFTGSIGVNRYVENNTGGAFATDPAFWRKTDVKGANNIPVFIDSQYNYFWSSATADPPDYDGAFGDNEMEWQCINRHMGFVGVIFMDWSARMVGLKQLWTLKFNRTYDTCGPWTMCGNGGKPVPNWPQWMKGFKDY